MDKLERNKFAKTIIPYLFWSAAGLVGTSLLFLYFKDVGLSELQLALLFLAWSSAPIISILALNKIKLDSKWLQAFGIIFIAATYFLLYLLPPSIFLLFLQNIAAGMVCFFFWVPFNLEYFDGVKGREATLSSVYFSIWPTLSLVLPIASGWMAKEFGFKEVFLLTSIIYLCTLSVIFLSRKRVFSYELETAMKKIKGFKTLMFIEGIYGGGITVTMALIPLLYFTKPLELGAFISISTILGVIASIIFGRISDKNRKRKKYIEMFGTGIGMTTILGVLANSSFGWYIFSSVRNFFGGLFWPFTTSIFVDNQRNCPNGMVGRELVLNSGRLLGVAIVCLFILLFSIHASLAILGLIMLGYPLIIELKKRHIVVG